MRLPLARGSREFVVIGLAMALASSSPRSTLAQNRAAYPDTQPIKPRVELFGQLVTDVIYDFEQNNPNWFDVVRPTQLPAFSDEFGRDGRMFYSVRPTRLGMRTAIPTKMGQVNGIQRTCKLRKKTIPFGPQYSSEFGNTSMSMNGLHVWPAPNWPNSP